MTLTTPAGAKPALVNVIAQINRYLRSTGPEAPRRVYSVDAVGDLPPAADYRDCIAHIRGTGLVVSDGTSWV